MDAALTLGMLNDLNWKTWALAFLIALGGTFELIKNLPESKVWDTENLRAPKVMRPYAARKSNAPALLPAMGGAPARLSAKTPQKYTPPPLNKEQLNALLAKQNPPGQATTDDKAEKKKGDDEWEIVIDPKTGKKVKRKKKKVAKKDEKKKDEEKKEVAKVEEKKPVVEDDDASNTDIDEAINTAITTGKLNPRPPNKPDDPFEGVEEWAKRLLGKPNLSETMRFIDHLRKNLVTPEVFFKIVGMMLEDSRAEMKKLGILACAATTTYPMSFQLLAGASTNTRNDAAVKAEADKALNAYIEFSKLGVLERVLKGGAPSLAFTAAVLLEKSAQKNLGAQAQAGTAAPTPTPTPTVQQRTINAYKRFVDILGALTRTSPDPKVKTQAGQTLATLQGLLGNTATVAQQQ